MQSGSGRADDDGGGGDGEGALHFIKNVFASFYRFAWSQTRIQDITKSA